MERRLGWGEKQPSDLRQSCAQPSVCHNLFSFPLGVIGRLYSVIVALPGHLYFFFVLTLCMLGNFACFLSSRFFKKKNTFFKKIFQEYNQTESVKQFGSRSDRTFCRV